MVLNPSAAFTTCLSALRPNPSHATTAVNPKIRESAKTPRTILSGQATSAINAADRKRLMVCQNFTAVLFVRGKPLVEFLIRLVVNGYGDWMSAAEKRCVRVFLRQATTPRQIKTKTISSVYKIK
jgi:hypothetical protein